MCKSDIYTGSADKRDRTIDWIILNWKGTKILKINFNISAYFKNALNDKTTHTVIFLMQTFSLFWRLESLISECNTSFMYIL
jgi:hypothetical protein